MERRKIKREEKVQQLPPLQYVQLLIKNPYMIKRSTDKYTHNKVVNEYFTIIFYYRNIKRKKTQKRRKNALFNISLKTKFAYYNKLKQYHKRHKVYNSLFDNIDSIPKKIEITLKYSTTNTL